LWIERDDVQTVQPAVTDTYGRNAVWADYECVLHLNEASGNGTLGEFVDSTGNGYDAHLTTGASITGTTANHPFGGSWLDFTTAEALTLPGSASMLDGGDVTLGYMCHIDISDVSRGSFGNFSNTPDNNWHQIQTNGKARSKTDGAHDVADPGPLTINALHSVQMTHTSTHLRVYVDGVEVATDSIVVVTAGIIGAVDYRIGTYHSNSLSARADGRIGGIRAKKTASSPDRIATEDANKLSVTAWGTVGDWVTEASSQSGLQWGILQNQATLSDLQWGILQNQSSLSGLQWVILQNKTSTTDARWDINQPAESAVNIQWALSAAASTSLGAQWDVLSLALSGFGLRWDVSGQINSQLAFQWGILSATVASLDSRWDVQELIIAGATLEWSVIGLVGSDLTLRWNTKSATEFPDLTGVITISVDAFQI
jgi:hypothetical protein